MADIEIISQKPLTLAEVKVKVDKISSKGKEELSARMIKVRDYMNDFSLLEAKESWNPKIKRKDNNQNNRHTAKNSR
jgi:DNA-directed RNA polymerase subunit F